MRQATRPTEAEHDFAYVFDSFPSYDKTFCAREVLGLQRLRVLEPLCRR